MYFAAYNHVLVWSTIKVSDSDLCGIDTFFHQDQYEDFKYHVGVATFISLSFSGHIVYKKSQQHVTLVIRVISVYV